jgi:hypothetical protein
MGWLWRETVMHRFPTLIAALALLVPLTVFGAPDPEPPRAPGQLKGGPRVRPDDRRSAALLVQGLRLSPTIRQLVAQLEERQVVVYIQIEKRLKGRLAGSLTWIAGTPHIRYVRVSINPDVRGAVAVAVLGHELQHAIEVANEPSIVDNKSLNAFYREHGISMSSHRNDWDTDAARLVGEGILRDLAHARNSDVLESLDDFDPLQWHVVHRRARERAPEGTREPEW